jgi:hypothetical protein
MHGNGGEYGIEARQQTSEGDQEPSEAHSQRQALGTRAHLALHQ